MDIIITTSAHIKDVEIAIEKAIEESKVRIIGHYHGKPVYNTDINVKTII